MWNKLSTTMFLFIILNFDLSITICLLWLEKKWNKWNTIKSKSAEIPRSTIHEIGSTHARKKEPSLQKGEIRLHFSTTHQTGRTFFNAAASKVARLLAKSWGFACRLYLLLARRHAETSIVKSTNLDLSTTGDVKYNLTPCLGDATISFGFRKNLHHPQNGRWTQK